MFGSWTHLDRAAPFFDRLSFCSEDKGTAQRAQNIVLGWTWILWRRRRPRVWEDSCIQEWPGSWKIYEEQNYLRYIYAHENRPQTLAPCLIKNQFHFNLAFNPPTLIRQIWFKMPGPEGIGDEVLMALPPFSPDFLAEQWPHLQALKEALLHLRIDNWSLVGKVHVNPIVNDEKSRVIHTAARLLWILLAYSYPRRRYRLIPFPKMFGQPQ